MNFPVYSQQPGQNLLIYINKYRDLHWWCTKKLPQEETYKLTLSQFCSSLQDPIGRKLWEKTMGWQGEQQVVESAEMLWQSYTSIQVVQNNRTQEGLKRSLETSVEVNETSYQHKPNCGGQHSQQLQQLEQLTRLQEQQQLQWEDNIQQWPLS